MPEPALTPIGRGAVGLGRSRQRSRGSRAMRLLAVLMIAGGILVLADGAVTLLWQEPFSALYASIRQHRLEGALAKVEAVAASPVEERTLAEISDEHRRIAYLASQLQHNATPGSPVGRIEIPRIGADYVVIAGTGTEELKSGPGLYSDTNYPGIGGTTAIAGHRTTYLAPFRDINELRPGDHIDVQMPYARFTFTVTGQRVVAPTDVRAATAQLGYSRLVLSACTPLFSAEKRLLVYARLTRTKPLGAARLLIGGIARTLPLAPPKPRRLDPMLESLNPHAVSPLV